MKIHRLPENDRTNGWSAIIPERAAHKELADEARADWVVLGGGYAGLAAARRLAENRPNESVVLIEAGQIGENASGRNSGFAIDLPHNVGSSLDELEGSYRFMRLARMAIDHLETMVDEHGIQCNWRRSGKYHTASSPRGAREVLEPFRDELEALGEPYRWLEGRELRQALGTPHFAAAVYTPGCVLMNPAALTGGLADSMPENVTVHENSPVLEAEFSSGVVLKTASGSVRAPRMIMAANGFSEQFGFNRRKFLHFVAHASLTRPLSQEERARYSAPEPWGVTPANAFVAITMRFTEDNRMLIRHGIHFRPGQRLLPGEQEKVRKTHKRLFDQRFPGLENVGMEHTWSGFVCLSRNGAPAFGELAPNIWSATCQNAVGVTKGTFGGILAADMATGRDNPLIEDMLSLGKPSLLPPRPFLDIGVRARFQWELWRNRHEA